MTMYRWDRATNTTIPTDAAGAAEFRSDHAAPLPQAHKPTSRRLAACWNACQGITTDELLVAMGLSTR